jgi:PAS domain-containing protein
MNKKITETMADETLCGVSDEKLSENRVVPPGVNHETDSIRLLHELQVYQIEVEMQNEELRNVNSELTKSEALNYATLQVIPMNIAVIDAQGNIIIVNSAWEQFALCNKGNHSGLGDHYLAVCRRAAAGNDITAEQAAVGIESILSGAEPKFVLEYPCHSPDEQRWFLMTVVSVPNRLSGGSDYYPH